MSAQETGLDAGGAMPPATVKVWDPFVRVFHWSLVGLFAFAFLTGDECQQPHELAGLSLIHILMCIRDSSSTA